MSDDTLTLTIHIAPDPTSKLGHWLWTAACPELGVVTKTSVTPQYAMCALGNAVRELVNSVMEARGLIKSADGMVVMREIIAGVAGKGRTE